MLLVKISTDEGESYWLNFSYFRAVRVLSTWMEIEASGVSQYLYFCTSKASNLRTKVQILMEIEASETLYPNLNCL
jgi:hypothetical protein